MTPSNSPGLKIGGRCKQRAIILYAARVILLCNNRPLAVMQNIATFEWLLLQQGSIGGKFK